MQNTFHSNSDEFSLVAQTLAGHSEPFWELVRPHLRSVSRMVRLHMGDDGEAEDVLQDTLLKAFTQLRQFRFESSFRTWLTQIALNEVRQCWRRPVRTRFFAFEDCGLKQDELLEILPSQLEACERQEKVKQIGQAIASLPEQYRTILKLREFEQLSIVDTAQTLRLSVSAVKSRHRRARLYISRRLSATAERHGAKKLSND